MEIENWKTINREKTKDDQFCKFGIYVPVFTGLFDLILCISCKIQKRDITPWQYCVLCCRGTGFYFAAYFPGLAQLLYWEADVESAVRV